MITDFYFYFLINNASFSVMSSQTECCNWIQVCSLLLSEIKGTPVSFLHLEELRNLFGSEVHILTAFAVLR